MTHAHRGLDAHASPAAKLPLLEYRNFVNFFVSLCVPSLFVCLVIEMSSEGDGEATGSVATPQEGAPFSA